MSSWQNNTADDAFQLEAVSSTTMSCSVGSASYELTIDAYFTLLPRRCSNYGRKWCKWWPGEAKTLYAGSLMRVWLTMDQNESRTMEHELLTTFTASTRCWCEKKTLEFDYLDLWAVGAKATAHLDVPKPQCTEMGGWTLTHGPLSFSDICLH